MTCSKNFMTVSRRILLAAALCLQVSAPRAMAAEAAAVQKIGFVDYAKIFQQMPETKTAEQNLQAAKNQTNTELQQMQGDLQKSVQAYLNQKQKSGKADPKKEKDLQSREENFRKTVADKQGLLARKEQDLVAPIRQKIEEAIKTVSQKEGYSMILDKNARVYGSAEYDITIKVIDQLNIK